jgi:hypothetical protein
LENSSNFRNFYLALYGIKYVVADVIPEMLMLFLLLNYKSPKIAKLTRNFISPCRITPVEYKHFFNYVSPYAL